jgi:simple sugar transport system permease protein
MGFLVALLVILVIYFVLRRTPLGLRMRAVGLSKNAAHFNGVQVGRTMLTAALVSGGIAGLAGVGEMAGIHFHLIAQISPGYGYTGIIAATLGGLNPLGVGLAALFIGLIDTGAQTVSSAMNIPIYLGNVVEATLLLVTLGMFTLQNYRIKIITPTHQEGVRN